GRAHPAHPAHPDRPEHAKGRPPKLSDLRELPHDAADVCALGRKFGKWHKDSPESRICAGVSGD
ncbi:hypothetical protein ACM614_24720, partial [Streptomyces sp. 12297]